MPDTEAPVLHPANRRDGPPAAAEAVIDADPPALNVLPMTVADKAVLESESSRRPAPKVLRQTSTMAPSDAMLTALPLVTSES